MIKSPSCIGDFSGNGKCVSCPFRIECYKGYNERHKVFINKETICKINEILAGYCTHCS